MVFLQLLLMILSLASLLSQLLTWSKQPCAWTRELFLERGTRLCLIVIHSSGNYWDMDTGIKKDIWSVMEDFAKVPGDKDLKKMKTQYQMFVDVVDSKQVTV
jgi:hypothetical protein